MSHDTIRRLLDDAYRAQGPMSVGPPRVEVDASQLKALLEAHDYYRNRIRDVRRVCERLIAEGEDEDGVLHCAYIERMVDAACDVLQLIDLGQHMPSINAEFSMDPQHGPIVTVTVDDRRISIYLMHETGTVTRSDGGGYGIEVKGPWHKFRQLVETPMHRKG